MFGFKCPEDGTEGREGERNEGMKEGKMVIGFRKKGNGVTNLLDLEERKKRLKVFQTRI